MHSTHNKIKGGSKGNMIASWEILKKKILQINKKFDSKLVKKYYLFLNKLNLNVGRLYCLAFQKTLFPPTSTSYIN